MTKRSRGKAIGTVSDRGFYALTAARGCRNILMTAYEKCYLGIYTVSHQFCATIATHLNTLKKNQ